MTDIFREAVEKLFEPKPAPVVAARVAPIVTRPDQDATARDGNALDALALQLAAVIKAVEAIKNESGLIDAGNLKDLRDSLIDAEAHLEGAQESINEHRTWLCEGPSCERLDWRLRAELNASERADGGGWCEECAKRDREATEWSQRQDMYR